MEGIVAGGTVVGGTVGDAVVGGTVVGAAVVSGGTVVVTEVEGWVGAASSACRMGIRQTVPTSSRKSSIIRRLCWIGRFMAVLRLVFFVIITF